MSNFFLQLGADAITVLMYIATIVIGVFAGIGLKKMATNKKAK